MINMEDRKSRFVWDYRTIQVKRSTTKAIEISSWRPWSSFEEDMRKLLDQYLDAQLIELRGQILLQQSVDPLLNDALWGVRQAALRDVFNQVFEQIVLFSIGRVSQVLDQTGIVVDWGLINERAVSWAREHAGVLVTQVTDTTRNALGQLVADSIKEGWTSSQLSDKIASVTDDAGNLIFSKARSEVIAITESTNVFAHANEIGWMSGGYPRAVFKPTAHVRCRCSIRPYVMEDGEKCIMWYTAHDERVCVEEIITPMGAVGGCRGLHRMIVSEGSHLGEVVP